jgi:hypothetical protein
MTDSLVVLRGQYCWLGQPRTVCRSAVQSQFYIASLAKNLRVGGAQVLQINLSKSVFTTAVNYAKYAERAVHCPDVMSFHVTWSWISRFSSTSCGPCQNRVKWGKWCTVSNVKRLMSLTQLFQACCMVLFFLSLISKVKGATSFEHLPFNQVRVPKGCFCSICQLWSLW